MIRIKFVKPYGKKEGQGEGPHYESGREYTFSGLVEEGYAGVYIDRGLAVEVKDEPKPEPKPVPVAARPTPVAPKPVSAKPDDK